MLHAKVRLAMTPEAVIEAVMAAKVGPLERCALLVEAEAKRLLSRGEKGERPPEGDATRGPYRYRSSPAGQPPFLRTGNLRASIRHERTARGTYIVGPTNVAWYGRVHEFGAAIAVTPRMRGFLRWKFGWNVSPKTTRIVVPKRPFMRPALDNCRARFPEQFRGMTAGVRGVRSGKA
ncbi:MAG: hypothetical protein N3A38_07595 [Planctomycetota bacterium]|nr:hypothetical protein [Planctomycetota bacterium]